jgi:hypothetical protein
MDLEGAITPLSLILASIDSKLTELMTSLDTHFCGIKF